MVQKHSVGEGLGEELGTHRFQTGLSQVTQPGSGTAGTHLNSLLSVPAQRSRGSSFPQCFPLHRSNERH